MKLNRTPNPLDRNARNGENDNWDIIEDEVKKVTDVVDDFVGTVTDEVVGELIDQSKLNRKEPVASFDDLPSGADVGDTIMTRDDGKVYRYDGTKWQWIEQIDATAINEVDSRLTSQLADTATKEELQDVGSSKMDKNTNDISISQINKNKGLIDETYLSEDLLQQMAGDTPLHSVPADKSITNIKLANDSVGIENISFGEKTENLFDGYQKGIIDTAYNPRRLYGSDTGVVAVVSVENDSKYFVRKLDESDRLRIMGTVDKPSFDGMEVNTSYGVPNDEMKVVDDTGDNNYLVIQVSNSNEMPRLNVTKDADFSSYLPPKQINGSYVLDKSMPVSKMTFSKKTVNLFNKYLSGIISTTNSPWQLAGGPEGVVTVVPVENNSTYHVRLFDESDRLRIVGTIDKPNFDTLMESNTHYGIANADSRTIVDTYDNNYLVIQVSNSLQTPRINITKDVDYEYYIPPYVIDKNYVENSENDGNKKPRLFGDFNKMYKSETIEGTAHLDLRNATFDIVYDEYDDLLDTYSDITEKKLWGYGTGSDGNEDTNLPIYEYVITNPHERAFTRPLPNYSPTILLMTGIHGHEKSSVWGAMHFITQLLENWYEDDSLASIKNNVTFKIIPVANPGGFNNDVRTNNNGVDLNRNFGYKHDESTSGDKGSAPYSEYESKIIRDWIADNASDSTIFIDYHNTREEIGTSYISTANESVSRAYSSMIKRLSAHWDYKYRDKLSTVSYGWVENNQNPMSYNEAYHINNITLSSLLETTWDFEGVRHTDETMEMAVEVLANYLLAVLNIYNDSGV